MCGSCVTINHLDFFFVHHDPFLTVDFCDGDGRILSLQVIVLLSFYVLHFFSDQYFGRSMIDVRGSTRLLGKLTEPKPILIAETSNGKTF